MKPASLPGVTSHGVERILDANVNRLKEGLRVCEEICRFVLDDRRLTAGFKRLRHEADLLSGRLNRSRALITSRFTEKDVGRTVSASGEFRRNSVRDVFYANVQRVKESLRVLEEFSKLKDPGAAAGFQKARYCVYEIEKRTACRFAFVCPDRQAGMRAAGDRDAAPGGRPAGGRRRTGTVKR